LPLLGAETVKLKTFTVLEPVIVGLPADLLPNTTSSALPGTVVVCPASIVYMSIGPVMVPDVDVVYVPRSPSVPPGSVLVSCAVIVPEAVPVLIYKIGPVPTAPGVIEPA